jgi:DNA-binding NtrC family response regulator
MKVLVADDQQDHRQYLAELIASWDYEVSQAVDGKEAYEILSSNTVDVLVTDLMMPRMDGFELLKTLGAEGRLPPSIVMTAFGSIEKALETVHQLGGYWYLEKPVDVKALRVLLTRACAQSRLAAENEELRRELSFRGAFGNLIGSSPAMTRLFDLIRQIAPTTASVLITGESGTGKEMVARALHENSLRKNGPFVALNCAAIPETLIESELFGHEKGAFTGAVERRIGALESGNGGTLFLDEIGEMPAAMQAKLLRVLEDFQFRRLGSRQELKANVRILAATNRDPLTAIKEGKLREDLYYRINVFHLDLPPLRERKEDIPLLVEAMIHNLNRKHDTRVTNASPEFLANLQSRNWEGNVRELRNIVERAVILTGMGPIRATQIQSARDEAPADAGQVSAPSPQARWDPDSIAVRVGMTIGEAERLLIEATLQHTGMSKARAASILDISTKTLHAKVKQYESSAGEAEESASA